ncbi:hypothetical protein [Flavobacterium fluviatile]|uniref:hypothetical protein n=1 Tax=Flavobacterium fluviatile TaxID=1862387 RepID=UPI0013D10486|nr:hypothetical protein [Flavobacterium fluviatile]
MAGGTITRVASGGFTSHSETYLENFNEITHSAGSKVIYNAEEQHYVDNWEEIPVGKHFVKGWWTDDKDKPIKKAYIGDTIRFHLETKDIKDGEEVNFTVYDWDGILNLDDKLSLIINGTSSPYNKITIKGNKGIIEWTTGSGTQKLVEEEGDDEVELYVSCSYKGEVIELPYNMDDYLVIFEKEVLITVIIELPHSYYTIFNDPVSALGMAGHSAMAIGQRYFDYGPNNTPGTYSENEYDVDFNNDGDRNDNVFLDRPSYKNSPGQPWWGTHIANKKKIKPEQVTLDMALKYIQLSWKDVQDVHGNIIHYGTYIYGEVHKIEFYVKEHEADKMLKWWEERYKHLKIYSAYPWRGEQCTTTVKTAIQQAFPFNIIRGNNIPDTTQKPSGLLEDLRAFTSTSKEHLGQLAKVSVIKKEAIDFKG